MSGVNAHAVLSSPQADLSQLHPSAAPLAWERSRHHVLVRASLLAPFVACPSTRKAIFSLDTSSAAIFELWQMSIDGQPVLPGPVLLEMAAAAAFLLDDQLVRVGLAGAVLPSVATLAGRSGGSAVVHSVLTCTVTPGEALVESGGTVCLRAQPYVPIAVGAPKGPSSGSTQLGVRPGMISSRFLARAQAVSIRSAMTAAIDASALQRLDGYQTHPALGLAPASLAAFSAGGLQLPASIGSYSTSVQPGNSPSLWAASLTAGTALSQASVLGSEGGLVVKWHAVEHKLARALGLRQSSSMVTPADLTYRLTWQASHSVTALQLASVPPRMTPSGRPQRHARTASAAQRAVLASADFLQTLLTNRAALGSSFYLLSSGTQPAGQAPRAAAQADSSIGAAAICGILKCLPYELPSLAAMPLDADSHSRGSRSGSSPVFSIAPGAAAAGTPGAPKPDMYGLALRGAAALAPVLEYESGGMSEAAAEFADAGDVAIAPRATGRYAVTGGSGGLGMLAASWMMQWGAGALVLIGRTGRVGDAIGLGIIATARCETVVVRGDVSTAEEAAAVAAAGAGGHRLAGVLHAAGLQVEARLLSQTAHTMRTVIAPKAGAVQAVGDATLLQAPDFTVLHSSVSSVAGQSSL